MTAVRYRFGDHVLDLAKHELRRNGLPVALPARVFECLGCLIEHRDRAVDRDELVQAIFGRADVSDAQLAQVVLRTRRAIGDDGQGQRAIRTVPRFGFRWVAEVTEEHAGQESTAGSAEVPAATPAEDMAPPPALMPVLDPPATTSPADRRRRWYLGAAGAGLALALLVLVWALQRPAGEHAAPANRATTARPSPRSVMVLPTEVIDSDETSWARLGLMDFIGDHLRRGGLPALSSETVLGVLREQANPAGQPREKRPDLQRLRRASQAAWIVSSRATRRADGSGWDVALVATDGNGLTQRGTARHADLLQGARLATDRLSAALGGRQAADAQDAPGLAERLQRARAAMLANEIETARKILTEAPELQRAQPRLRYQLARVDFRAGEFVRGLATLDDLLAGRDARSDLLFHIQLLNARGAMLIRLDRYPEAQRTYDEAVALADDGAHPAELGQALSGRAVVHGMQQQFDRGLADLGQARVQLGKVGDALAVARVDANLGILEVDRGRPAYALPYLSKAADDFAAMGAVNELATVRNARVLAYLQLLRTDEALAESVQSQPLLERVRDPMQRADLVLIHAAALTQAGRLREAGRLLQTPVAGQAQPSEFGRREYLQVELALHSGAARDAVKLADAALRTWPVDRNPRQRAWLRLRREQAALDADLGVSRDNIPALGDTLPDRLTLATLQRARGEQAAADASYRAALALAEQRGVPEEIAAVVRAYAGWLLERGRDADAGTLIGRVAPWAEHDFDLAVLQVRLLRASDQGPQWRKAFDHARTLAGERTMPPGLDPATAKPGGGALP